MKISLVIHNDRAADVLQYIVNIGTGQSLAGTDKFKARNALKKLHLRST